LPKISEWWFGGKCRFDERLKHMPTKGFIFATCAALLAAGGGLVALIVRFIPHV
jgi:hypothetical protein